MKRNIRFFEPPEHTKQLLTLGKSRGLRTSHIIRIAILEWIQREKRAVRAAAKI
jgi:hypothetical protein